jgi:hypothetical protein
MRPTPSTPQTNNETTLGIHRTRNGLDWRPAFKALGELANEAAPNKEAREAFRALEKSMAADGMSPESRFRGLLGRLHDGVMCGNWPAPIINK